MNQLYGIKNYGEESVKTEIIDYDSLSSIPDNPWKNRTEWLEYDLAVKWIALEARCDAGLAGFMHMIRHPERPYEWYFCDVHTVEPYRRQGVATALYKEALNLLRRYGKAYRVTGSVGEDNTASIKLHGKLGFFNTHEAPAFPGLSFECGETVFEHYFVKEFQARNTPVHQTVLAALTGDERETVCAELEKAGSDPAAGIFLLWAGETPVGYRGYHNHAEYVLLPEWQNYLDHNCLKIWPYEER